jgi:hypothetical protein
VLTAESLKRAAISSREGAYPFDAWKDRMNSRISLWRFVIYVMP